MESEIRNLKLEKAKMLDKLIHAATDEMLLRLGKVVFQISILEKAQRKTVKNIFDES